MMRYVSDEAEADGSMTTLRIGMVQSIDSLNPFIGINDNAYIFYGLVYDYLICLDEDLQPKPNLAVSWNIVDEYEPYGSVWQYNLTQNAYWHDGEKVDADDVVFTFNYQINEKWVAMWAYQPYTLLVSSVEKVDDYTVRLHFEMDGEPVACSFGDSLMMPIVPEHYWNEIHYIDAGFSHINPKPIGSGPFRCTDDTYNEFLRGDRLILYKNEEYHGPAEYGKEIQFDRLVLENYLEPAALLADLQRGAIDIAQFDAPTYMSLVDWLEKNPTDDIYTHAGRKCTGYSVEIGICMKDAAGQNNLRRDHEVRKAMAHATDKAFIVDHIYRGLGEIGSTILSPIYPEWYWEPTGDEVYQYDLDLANEILDDAGYLWNDDHTVRYAPVGHPWNNAGEDLQLRFDMVVEQEIIEDRATAQFLVEEWAHVGILIEPLYVDTALWGTLVYGGQFDTMLTYWSGDPDPNYLLYVQSTDALDGWSENWYSNPDYDENYTLSVLEVDQEARLEYVYNCQRMMYEDAAFIVTAYPFECTAWRTDHFSGWGDWQAHPGRALSNFWTANDLYFDLVPISSDEPPFVILDNVAGPADVALEVTAYAEDPEGASMEYHLDFGDGSNTTGSVPSDGEMSVMHTFGSPGVYLMNLTVSDEGGGSRETKTATIVEPGANAPPSNVRIAPASIKGEIDSEMVFTVTGKDVEGDPVSIIVSFGDGSKNHTTSVSGTTSGFETTAEHTYDETGVFSVTVHTSDGESWSNATILMTIVEPSGGGSTILIVVVVLVIAAVAVAVVVMMRRKKGGRPRKEEKDIRLP
jgi:peptide/nickel transport system substrate-binding protein